MVGIKFFPWQEGFFGSEKNLSSFSFPQQQKECFFPARVIYDCFLSGESPSILQLKSLSLQLLRTVALAFFPPLPSMK